MIDKAKVVCFSGHRQIQGDLSNLKEQLNSFIIKLIEQGVIFFGAGGALGFDMLAEETILELKEKYPKIKLVLPCPPEQQTLKWNNQQRKRYYHILEKADKIRILSPVYTNDCMLARNRHLVENSEYLVCYLRNESGGTFYTVKYAEKLGLKIIRL